MRSLLLAGVAAVGFGLLAPTASNAAPAGGTILTPPVTESSVVDVRYRCWRTWGHAWYSRRGHIRKCRWVRW